MKNKTLSCALLVGAIVTLNAQNENTLVGASVAGMGNAGVSSTSIWSTSHNQAGLAFLEHSGIGINYESRFLNANISTKSIAGAFVSSKGTIGLSIRSFGVKNYSENKIGLAFARAFGPNLAVALQANWNNISQPAPYQTLNRLTLELGLQYKFNEQLTIGAHVFNPTQTALIKSSYEKIPTVFKLGLSYKPNQKVVVATEVEQSNNQNLPLVKLGVNYDVATLLSLRTGVTFNSLQNFVGVGLHFKNFDLDVATAFHATLGISSQLGLTYHFKSKPSQLIQP